MEIWDVYDERRNLTGREHVRGEPMPLGDFHLVVHVWMRHSDGRFLISQRDANKPFGNLWESCGGSAIKGDDSLSAALREAEEEVGMVLNPKKGQLIRSSIHPNIEVSKFVDVWLFDHEVDESKIVCQEGEVQQARLATLDEIKALLEAGEFQAHQAYIFDYIS